MKSAYWSKSWLGELYTGWNLNLKQKAAEAAHRICTAFCVWEIRDCTAKKSCGKYSIVSDSKMHFIKDGL